MMSFNKNSRYRIWSYILWLIVLILLTLSVECHNSDDSDVCTTPGCKAAAYVIKNSINATQDPCKNFYNFACGNFKKNVKIPEGQQEIGAISILDEIIKNNITEALNEDIDPNEPKIFKSVKNYYNACMDLETINNIGLQPLLDIINDLGGWPIVVGDNWNEAEFDWIETVHKLRQLGYLHDYIITMNVVPDENDRSKSLLEIGQGETFLDADDLQAGWNSWQYQAYVKYIVDIAVLLGADPQFAFWDAFNAIYLERYISIYAHEDYTNETVRSIEDIDKPLTMPGGSPIPEIPWLEYLNNVTSPVINFTATDKVRVLKPQYLADLPIILKTAGKRNIANYLIWRAIAESAQLMSEEMRAIHDDYQGIYNSRNDHCLNLLLDKSSGIPVGIDALYVRKYVDNVNDARKDVNNLIKYMADQLELYINQLTWLDDKTRNGALQKAQSMKKVIGFPEELYNDIIMDKLSFDLNINSSNHFQNFLNTQRFNFEHRLSELHNFTDEVYDNRYSEVNAYYITEPNRIVINPAMLFSPFYSLDWPNYMKYGALGCTIGHEMMHAYGNSTLFFDAMVNHQWYTDESALKYQDRMKCFVQQYEHYYDEKLKLRVNGSRTLDENLADYGGNLLGYSGYKKWVAENGKELPLPGLDYTPEQIFWIMSANFECSKSNEDYKIHIMLNGNHTLDKYRVFGMMENSKDFAKDFNCPAGSKMNPKEKCSLAK